SAIGAGRVPDRPIKVLVAIAVGAVLYFASAAFIPVALALLPSLVLSGPIEALQRRRVPRPVGAALIVVVVLSLIAGGVASFWNPAQEWYAKAPQTVATIRAKVGPIAQIMNRLDELRSSAGAIATPPEGKRAPPQAPEPAGKSAPALLLDIG